MNRKISYIVTGIMIVLATIVVAVQLPDDLRAESNEQSQVLMPVVFTPSAPQLELFVSGIALPTVITDIVDPGDGRFFIATRDGRIHISAADGTLLPGLLLDISSIVYDDRNEAGLVGLETHPDFENNGLIFLFYNELVDNVVYSVLARYHVGPDGKADPASEKRLLHLEMSTARHHAGALHFGPKDGYLYVAIGDGGSGRDWGNFGQRTDTLLGKILRIDVDNGDPYSIPPDNPFVSHLHVLDEIWALGLRNPWRFSFDRETGDMYIGDVGETKWEEINFIPAGSGGGQNFGWSCKEGPDDFELKNCQPGIPLTPPIFYYPHLQTSCGSVTGGFVYHGTLVPELAGHYVFADFCYGRIWSLMPDGNNGWIPLNWGKTNRNITTIGERHDGELFIGSNNVYQLVGTGHPK